MTDLDSVVIAPATPPDLPVVDALQRQSFSTPWGLDAIRWELEHTDVARLHVARWGALGVVAYCNTWLIFDELHINSLAVAPAVRRAGLARHLLRFVLAEARAQGAVAATLEVRHSNTAARLLYEALGFGVEGTRRGYYQHPTEDALVLWNRDLRPFLW